MIDDNSKKIIEAVALRLNETPKTAAIIDLACGEGWLLEHLIHQGFSDLTGVSHTRQSIKDVHNIGDVDLCRENWSGACGQKSYHVALATEVIEHLTNPYLFLSEVFKLLVPGGKLVLTFPNVHNLRSIVGYAVAGRFSGFFGPNFNAGHPLYDQHIFIPNLHLIRYLLRVAGFTVESEHYVNGSGRMFAYTTLIVARRDHGKR